MIMDIKLNQIRKLVKGPGSARDEDLEYYKQKVISNQDQLK